eukprot:tig00000403_g340.t1
MHPWFPLHSGERLPSGTTIVPPSVPRTADASPADLELGEEARAPRGRESTEQGAEEGRRAAGPETVYGEPSLVPDEAAPPDVPEQDYDDSATLRIPLKAAWGGTSPPLTPSLPASALGPSHASSGI